MYNIQTICICQVYYQKVRIMSNKIPAENERMAFYFKLAGLKQVSVADILGIKQQTVSQILNGKSGISDQVLRVLELQFGLNPEWIRMGEGNMVIPEEDRRAIQPLKLARIPILKDIPAGKWESWKDIISTDIIDGFIDLPSLPGNDFFAVVMPDRAMEPRILKGEIVVVAPNKIIKEIALIRQPQGFIIRGIERCGDEYRFQLHALNPTKKDDDIIPDDETVLYTPVKVMSLRDI